jgi:putative membrane-bound dehydrogenase-like protein
MRTLASLIIFILLLSPSLAFEPPPRVLVEGWSLQVIDSEPGLVTPVSCRCDRNGNLYVVECHTHMPPNDYPGPKVDRVYLYRDRQPDGTFAHKDLFHQGTAKTMGLAVDDNGWVYLAMRTEIIRVKDSDGDFKSDVVESLIQHETKADYPHNGLSGLCLSPDGSLYFGQGENFGEQFTVRGADGSVQRGSGEGGSVYRCSLDGKRVQRIATGIWNPFGLSFDSKQRLWCVDNDPDSRPPCRLLQIVPTADYGFQFRFGRAGTNPLLAWDGELPGTLPMTAGTGEAPCEVVQVGDRLLVTSWGDNRIESFAIKSVRDSAATLTGELQVLVQGGSNFRPVSLATADDGSIYFTDWVDRSYPVHGKGKLWRLIPPADVNGRQLAGLSQGELLAQRLASGGASDAELAEAVESTDPFVQHAASNAKLARSLAVTTGSSELAALDIWQGTTQNQRLENLRMMRWQSLSEGWASKGGRAGFDQQIAAYNNKLHDALKDESVLVRLLAIRYAAESGNDQFLQRLEMLLANSELKTDEFNNAVAAISFLRSGSASGAKRDPARDQLLVSIFLDASRPVTLRQLALRQMPATTDKLAIDQLIQMLRNPKLRELHRDILSLLAQRRESSSELQLQAILEDQTFESGMRADVLATLAASAAWRDRWAAARESIPLVLDRKADPLKLEESRVLLAVRRATANTQRPGSIGSELHPPNNDTDEWLKICAERADAARGWRVWVRSQCVSCHALHGRGAEVGPDLSAISKSHDSRRLLESILQPSLEVAPLYASWQVMTVDGRVLSGAKLNGGGAGTNLKFLSSDGSTFELSLDEIESQQLSHKSIMPDDVAKSLSVDELADLWKLLAEGENAKH